MRPLIALLVLGVAGPAAAECEGLWRPTAAAYRAQFGRPDDYKTTTCGGGKDEYGDTIKPWKCLIWKYEGKGGLYFSAAGKKGDGKGFLVLGCGTPSPRVEPTTQTIWRLESCVDLNGKDKRCSEVNLGLDPEHWEPPPGGDGLEDLDAFVSGAPPECGSVKRS